MPDAPAIEIIRKAALGALHSVTLYVIGSHCALTRHPARKACLAALRVSSLAQGGAAWRYLYSFASAQRGKCKARAMGREFSQPCEQAQTRSVRLIDTVAKTAMQAKAHAQKHKGNS